MSKLENLNVDIMEAAKYLISLYYATGEKYYCSRRTIANLLTIAALQFAYNKKNLFNCTLYKNSEKYKELKSISVIIGKIGSNTNMPIEEQEFLPNPNIPEEYKNVNLSAEIKASLKSIFLKFGDYDSLEYSNNIIYTLGMVSNIFETKINLENIDKVDKYDSSKNIVLDYIKNEEIFVDELENLNVDIMEAAKYLISLYYATGEKYYCSRRIISSLLTVATLLCAYNKKRLFNSTLYRNSEKFKELKDIKIAIGHSSYHPDQPIKEDEFIINPNTPDEYKNINLNDNTKKILKDVFLHFGAYDGYQVYVSGILDNVSFFEDKVDLKRVKEQIKDLNWEGNYILDYVRTRDINQINDEIIVVENNIINNNIVELKELDINIIEASKYFLMLFYQVGNKYRCTPYKLGRLLIISSLLCAKYGYKLFNNEIDIESTCISDLFPTFDNNLVDAPIENDKEERIKESEFINAGEPDYLNYFRFPFFENKGTGNALNDNIKKLLRDVFINFGAYAQNVQTSNLHIYLDQFLGNIESFTNKGKVDLNQFYKLYDLKLEDKNPIFNYVMNRDLKRIINNINNEHNQQKILIKQQRNN